MQKEEQETVDVEDLQEDDDEIENFSLTPRILTSKEQQESFKLAKNILFDALGEFSYLVLHYLDEPVKRNHMPVINTAEASLR